MSGDDAHLRALGQRILSEANDLKRTPAALANELGIHFDTIMAVIKGDRDKMTTRNVIDAMVDTYPVAMADLWIEPDDTDDGVRLMSAADSAASKRVVERLDRTGGLSPYYEYRDTATSASAPFKPEWIEELRQVGDACADNPDVAYNKGHLLHQTTFFIGPVNFYWRSGGSSHCAELNTGDSNYISPFVPHSFASRDPNRRGLIVAVTFAGQVHRATADIGRMGAQAAASLAGDLRDATAQARRLRRHVDAECLSVTNFSHLIAERGIHANRVAALLDGAQPNGQE
ncbi:MAG: hypothetical protein HOI95_26840, partial [Chromatiales bacterium]|nr:hypothetical protein [Chromatiales bacterium]